MIIEAGTDFLELGLQKFCWDDGSSVLCVILMTGDLRYLSTRVITNSYDGKFDDVVEAILEAVDVDFVRYFAIVEQCEHLPKPDRHDEGDQDGLLSHSEMLTAAAELRGLRLLSHVYVGPEYWRATGPMYGFEDCPLSEDVPRIRITRPNKYVETRLASG